MRESPVARITCLMRRNFMRFILNDAPVTHWACGALTLDANIIRLIFGKVIQGIGPILGQYSKKFVAGGIGNVEFLR